jgi:NAD(P)-dependent dehydrogenase (short-subunit alcohol dehydrogenase family)
MVLTLSNSVNLPNSSNLIKSKKYITNKLSTRLSKKISQTKLKSKTKSPSKKTTRKSNKLNILIPDGFNPIGIEIIKKLLNNRYIKLIVGCRNIEEFQDTVLPSFKNVTSNLYTFQLNLEDNDSIHAFYNQLKESNISIDVFINNYSYHPVESSITIQYDTFKETMDKNFFTICQFIKTLFMTDENSTRKKYIIHLSSYQGLFMNLNDNSMKPLLLNDDISFNDFQTEIYKLLESMHDSYNNNNIIPSVWYINPDIKHGYVDTSYRFSKILLNMMVYILGNEFEKNHMNIAINSIEIDEMDVDVENNARKNKKSNGGTVIDVETVIWMIEKIISKMQTQSEKKEYPNKKYWKNKKEVDWFTSEPIID